MTHLLRIHPIKKEKKYLYGFFLPFTILFLLLSLLLFLYYAHNGMSLIFAGDDYTQHYRAFVYAVQYYRSIIRNVLISHSFSLKTFNFSLGFGADILTTLNYYAIGDPLVLLAVVVPTKYLLGAYYFLIFFRLYLSGICFSRFCLYVNREAGYHPEAVICGAFIYIFCGYTFFAGLKHPFFMNTLIYFPWMLLGTEKILREKRPLCFIFSVFVSACSNFYFFYMLVIIVAAYVIWRMFTLHSLREWKKMLQTIMRMAVFALIGLMMSAAVLLPVVIQFTSEQRNSNSLYIPLLYDPSYYRQLFDGFASYAYIGHWTLWGYGGIAILGLITLFYKKKKRNLKIAFLVLTALFFIPYIGSVMNGFSYPCNRWNWAYGMLLGYIFVCMWPDFCAMRGKQVLVSALALCCYMLLCIVAASSISSNTCIQVMIAFVLLIIAYYMSQNPQAKKKWLAAALVGLETLCVIVNGYYCYTVRQNNYVSDFKTIDSVDLFGVNEGSVVKKVRDKSFYRFGGTSMEINCDLTNKISSIQYYWSLSNPYVSQFLKEIYNRDALFYFYKGIDDRTFPIALSGVKYYASRNKKKDQVPYGFEKTETKSKKIQVYENRYFLPLGYTYDSVLSEEAYRILRPEQKQEALLESVVIHDPDETPDYPEKELTFDSHEIPFTVKNKKVSVGDHCFIVTRNNTSVDLLFDGMADAETYLVINNLSYEGSNKLMLYQDDDYYDPDDVFTDEDWEALSSLEQNKIKNRFENWTETSKLVFDIKSYDADGNKTVSKDFVYYTPKYKHYNNHTDYLINLCYSEKKKNKIRITFPEMGIYRYDDLRIVCQNMGGYEQNINERKTYTLQNINLNEDSANATNHVSGTIELPSDRILLLAIPFSKGWTAFVDGKKERLYRANTMFMALNLHEGEHRIDLRYQTPGLMPGCMISLTGFCLMILLVVYRKKLASILG